MGAIAQHRQAFLARHVQIAQHGVALTGTGHRAHLGRGVQRVTQHQRIDAAGQRGVQLIGDGLVHQQARGGRADLTGIEVDARHHPVGGFLDVGIIEHDDRRLAAKLQGDTARAAGRSLHDLLADHIAAGEGNLVDARMTGQRRADGLAIAVQQIEHARRQSGFQRDLGHHLLRQRRHFRRLDHQGAARGERRRDLPDTGDQREVPRRDQSHHTSRLVIGVRGIALDIMRDLRTLTRIQRACLGGVKAVATDGVIEIDLGLGANLAVVATRHLHQRFPA